MSATYIYPLAHIPLHEISYLSNKPSRSHVDKRTYLAIFLGVVVPLSAVWFLANYQTQLSQNGFGIYLTQNNFTVITDSDIQNYNMTSHDLILTNECAETMKRMKEPLSGDFVIMIDGEEDLHGLFVPPFVSRSYPSTTVVIIYPTFEENYKIMKIQMGYPWDQPISQDPRDNSKILQYFEKTGRLIQ